MIPDLSNIKISAESIDQVLARITKNTREQDPLFLVIDLFCGAGGTTTGFDQARINGHKIAKVIACVNHDAKAIESHWRNHPDVLHFEEDIRTLDVMPLAKLVAYYRKLYPNAIIILWASLECTNFSKAKGGQPRDADSRTLADHLHRYIVAIDPDYVQIENVVEFMSWGPLNEHGKPVSRKSGEDFIRWRQEICAHGYSDENGWVELNSANFGAFTSRNRLFGCFAKYGFPIVWPSPTHTKNPLKNGMFDAELKKWNPVKEVLDFTDEGKSIFNRDKGLSEKTLERIYAGLLKYIAKGDTAFIAKYYSGKPAGKVISTEGPAGAVTCVDGQSLVQPISLLKYNSTDKTGKHYPPSVEEPAPVVTTRNGLGLIQGEFIVQRNSGNPESKLVDVDGPARTLTATGGNQDLVQPCFLAHYYGGGGQHSSIENPAPVIPTKARTALISPEFLTIYNGKSLHRSVDEPSPVIPTNDRLSLIQPEFFLDKHFGAAQNQSIDQPAGTVMPNDKHRLVEAVPFIMPTNFDNGPKSIDEPAPTITASRKHHYIINPSWGGNPGSVEEPCCVVVARQDKAPLYFVQVEAGAVKIAVYESDSPTMVKMKQFMAVYGLIDIKMRMLRVTELLKIQGFPADYHLAGNQSDQKKFIGNSVVPQVVKAWSEAMASGILKAKREQVA
ncbi:MAG: DNA (cytosine-5-)-methyltransferase [Bacteroidetes bacterium]|nr:MAG: DNA (cytosine-5-)-methyltransferase [Bacteroidota bacterium]